MLACQRTSSALSAARSVHRHIPPHIICAASASHRRIIKTRASNDDKSWGEIASEAAEVVKDVARKVKDSASSALQAIIPGSKAAAPARQQQQQQQRGSIYSEDDRPLPMRMPGGILGGLMGGLVNTAVKGLAKELEKSAEQTRTVSEIATERISSSRQIKQRLGEVTVGLPVSQSVASQNINGRVTKTVNLLLPVYNAVGAPVAQAQVVQSQGQFQDSTKIVVRLPDGDSILLDDGGDDFSGRGGRSKVSQRGEIIDAEFRELN